MVVHVGIDQAGDLLPQDFRRHRDDRDRRVAWPEPPVIFVATKPSGLAIQHLRRDVVRPGPEIEVVDADRDR